MLDLDIEYGIPVSQYRMLLCVNMMTLLLYGCKSGSHKILTRLLALARGAYVIQLR